MSHVGVIIEPSGPTMYGQKGFSGSQVGMEMEQKWGDGSKGESANREEKKKEITCPWSWHMQTYWQHFLIDLLGPFVAIGNMFQQ